MRKIGLVIQGPLISVGKTGEQFYMTLEKLREAGGAVHYDCRPNIRRIISEFGHFFDEIVVSTWESEVREGDSFPGVRLVAAPDPGGIKRGNTKHYKDNNKFRQFLSMQNGLLELEKSGIDYAVKARTDTYLDLKKLLGSFLSGIEDHGADAIFAPVIHKPTFLLHDLYFASSLAAMKRFCEGVLSYDRFEFISSAHMEIVLKHAYFIYKEQIGVPDWAYFPHSPLIGSSSETRKIFDYMLTHAYFSLDPEIFRALEWRGSRFPADHVSSLVNDEASSKRGYSVSGIIATDWERYYNFRREAFGEPFTPPRRMRAKVAKLGWRAWNRMQSDLLPRLYRP
jgi:hypothetical protein